ncbi:ATP-dependent DNA ligase [Halorussus gelatinilyticus]|uniref:DNA ligase n=1 Tax=Halorussus gelatinilyticus TaxID=2937524 RepID=A0A8U0IFE1_9EURY|nr:ATP-dependent DNA ligase LigA [Halorussus gelatinilyticus]UPV99692.1 ATP-dependent DNA ligase [Halorussus gelatinilyticus]
MQFGEFADTAAEIEELSADTDITERVTRLFAQAGDDLPVLARFVQGRVFPAWSSRTLDIGPNYCYEAIARAAGANVSADDVEDRLAEVGDVGEVAASYDFGGQQGLGAFTGGGAGGAGGGSGGTDANDLTVAEVAVELDALAAAEGSGSQDKKIDVLFALFNRASSAEARYLARLVLSEMRIGVGEGTVRDATADAFEVPVEAVERALQVSNDYGEVARVARDEGESGLAAMDLELGRPVQAMLAQAGTVADALDDWDEAAVEWKYDGARVQIHYDPDGLSWDAADDGADPTRSDATADREVAIFSRNMEDVTDPLPEIAEYVADRLDRPAILDGEVVATEDGDPLPFQEVLRRFRRKHDVARAREEVELDLFAFDCLHAAGEDLLRTPLPERHDRLKSVFDAESESDAEDGSEASAVSSLHITDDPEEIAEIEAEALDAGHEGIMLKNPDSTYSPGRRGKNWLKRKPDVESLDLVVTGAEWGEGRRASFLGTFLLSARVEAGESFETLGKVATGITDEELEELTELLEPHVRKQEGQEVEIAPEVVFEVGYEEIQESPTYSSGYALRFPRFLGVRDDKDPESADSLARVERLADEQ